MPIANINNINLYYEIHGSGEPVLFITGLGGDAGYWLSILQFLSPHYQVVIFDNRGSGRSDSPAESYTMDVLVNDTLALLDHLHIQQTHIIGHSLGSMIAQRIAHDHPERVKKLVLYASSSKVSFLMRLGAKLIIHIKRAKHRYDTTGKSSWLLKLAKKYGFDNPQNVLPASSYQPQPESLPGYIYKAKIAMKFNSRAFVKNIKQPTLIIACGADKIFPVWHSQFLTRHIKNSQLKIMPAAQHWFHLENPLLFSQTILEFLREKVN